MYKKSIALFLISTLSLSLSSCSAWVSNTGSNISSVTSNSISSSAPKIEQSGPLSLGEIEFQSEQNVRTQENIISLQKDVDFLQQQAAYLQRSAGLLQEYSTMPVEIDDTGLTVAQKEAAIAKEYKFWAELTAQRQQEALKAFESAKLKQGQIWRLQNQMNTIPQRGLKTQADDSNTALKTTEAKIAQLQATIDPIEKQILETMTTAIAKQGQLNTPNLTTADKLKLTDEIKNLNISLFELQQKLLIAKNDLALEQENLLVLRKTIAYEAAQSKEQELKKQMDAAIKDQNDVNNQLTALLAEKDKTSENAKRLAQQLDQLPGVVSAACSSTIQERQRELSFEESSRNAIVAKRDSLLGELNTALKPLQDAFDAEEKNRAWLATTRGNNKPTPVYRASMEALLAREAEITRQMNEIRARYSAALTDLNNQVAQRDSSLALARDRFNAAQDYCKQQTALLEQVKKDYANNELSTKEIQAKIEPAQKQLTSLQSTLQQINVELSNYQTEIRKIDVEKNELMLTSAKNEADRKNQKEKAISEAETAKWLTLKRAEEQKQEILNKDPDEQKRQEAIKKAEEEQLAAIQKAEEEKLLAAKKELEEQTKAKEQEKIKLAELMKKIEDVQKSAPQTSTLPSFQPLIIPQTTPIPQPSVSPSAPKEVVFGGEKPTVQKSPSSSNTQYDIKILPESLNVQQNNTVTMRVFIKDSNGNYVTDNVKVESLNPDIAKVVKTEKIGNDLMVELYAVGSGEAKIKITVAESKIVSVFSTVVSQTPELQVWAISIPADNPPDPAPTQILWSGVEGADNYKIYIQNVDGTWITALDGDAATSPYTPGINCPGFPDCSSWGFRIQTLESSETYNVWVKAFKGLVEIRQSNTLKILVDSMR